MPVGERIHPIIRGMMPARERAEVGLRRKPMMIEENREMFADIRLSDEPGLNRLDSTYERYDHSCALYRLVLYGRYIQVATIEIRWHGAALCITPRGNTIATKDSTVRDIH